METIKKRLGILMGLLTTEFVLGMVINLFKSESPQNNPLLVKFSFLAHGVVGLLLLVGGIWLVTVAVKSKNSTHKQTAFLAALGILVAFAAGIATVRVDVAFKAYASFAMAMGFVLAISSCGRLLSSLNKK